jgi:hypothetical protein
MWRAGEKGVNAVGANPCVRPLMPGRHMGLPLQFRPETGILIFVDFLINE